VEHFASTGDVAQLLGALDEGLRFLSAAFDDDAEERRRWIVEYKLELGRAIFALVVQRPAHD